MRYTVPGTKKSKKLQIVDVSRKDRRDPSRLQELMYKCIGVVVVVDSTKPIEADCRGQLAQLSSIAGQDIPFYFVANKQDLEGATSVNELCAALGLADERGPIPVWCCQPCVATYPTLQSLAILDYILAGTIRSLVRVIAPPGARTEGAPPAALAAEPQARSEQYHDDESDDVDAPMVEIAPQRQGWRPGAVLGVVGSSGADAQRVGNHRSGNDEISYDDDGGVTPVIASSIGGSPPSSISKRPMSRGKVSRSEASSPSSGVGDRLTVEALQVDDDDDCPIEDIKEDSSLTKSDVHRSRLAKLGIGAAAKPSQLLEEEDDVRQPQDESLVIPAVATSKRRSASTTSQNSSVAKAYAVLPG